MRRPVLTLLCALAACSGGDKAAHPVRATPPTAAVTPVAQPAAKLAVAPFRLASKDAGRVAAIGPHVAGVGWGVRNREAVDLALDVAEGVRVVLAPQGELWSLERARSFLLVSGQAWVQSLPTPARAGEPRDLRWVTPAGSLVAASAGELRLRTELRGLAPGLSACTQLSLLRGGVTWFAAEGSPAALLTAEPRPPRMLGALQVLGAQSAAVSAKAWQNARPSALAVDADAFLERALSELAERRERSRALLTAAQTLGHTGADTAHVADVRAYQSELARRAQDSLASQQRALLAAEQSLWLTLARCPREPAEHCPALEHWGNGSEIAWHRRCESSPAAEDGMEPQSL